ncbi:MAG: hypothetical protein EBU90_05325 [Proteobacteria bacterium]|nr:hypothetical protein [Pseudomonadota bacterium]
MKLKTFLLNCSNQQPSQSPVIYFKSNEYPLLFFSQLVAKLKKANPSFKVINLQEYDWSQLQATLATTFLGSVQTLWLGDISESSVSYKKELLEHFKTYSGPHTVLCFVNEKEQFETQSPVIILNEPLSPADLDNLFEFFWATDARRFLGMVKQNYKTLSLDMIILLGQYSIVLGDKTELFMRTWYEKIVQPEESLFILAQSFFARKKDMFYRTWISLKNDYSEPFWTVYWSEQLWRAYHVVMLRNKQKLQEAKQMSYRLPFSFMQKDWQTTTGKELQVAHDFLYQVDCHVKTGGSSLALELFYHKFMNKDFLN